MGRSKQGSVQGVCVCARARVLESSQELLVSARAKVEEEEEEEETQADERDGRFILAAG